MQKMGKNASKPSSKIQHNFFYRLLTTNVMIKIDLRYKPVADMIGRKQEIFTLGHHPLSTIKILPFRQLHTPMMRKLLYLYPSG